MNEPAPPPDFTSACALAVRANLAIEPLCFPRGRPFMFKVYRKVGARRTYLGKRETPAELLEFVRRLARRS